MRITIATACRRGAALSGAVALAVISVAFSAEAPAAMENGNLVDQVGLLQISTEMAAQVTMGGLLEEREWSMPWDEMVSASQGYLQAATDSATRAMALTEVRAKIVSHQDLAEKMPSTSMSSSMRSIDKVLTASMGGVFLVFLLWSCMDFRRCYVLYQKHMAELKVAEAEGEDAKEKVLEPWPIWALVCLTLYRFYTGFLTATWLPYLLAMEGAELWSDNQALFMVVSKLLCGISILFTPIFGIFGDRIAEVSLAIGRRLFVRVGVIVAALGIFLCHWAAPRHHFALFLIGVFVWRVGEGFCDVTIEAICPEVLPKQQFEISGSIKAVQCMMGGLAGYIMLALARSWHYSWLYQAYLILMCVTALPHLLVVTNEEPKPRPKGRPSTLSQPLTMKYLRDAYTKPITYRGGFPRAIASNFLFSFGAAPPFYLLLMLCDLVGMVDYASLQLHFSFVSIAFFLSASVAAALNALTAPEKGQPGVAIAEERAIDAEKRKKRSFQITAVSIMFFGCICFFMPFIHMFSTHNSRMQACYIFAILLGTSFGSVYARYHACQWQLLPKNVETANALGLSTTAKLLGAGLGNFCSGLILDLFQSHMKMQAGADGRTTNLIAYHIEGYHVFCTISAVLSWASGYLVMTLPRLAEQEKEEDKATAVLEKKKENVEKYAN